MCLKAAPVPTCKAYKPRVKRVYPFWSPDPRIDRMKKALAQRAGPFKWIMLEIHLPSKKDPLLAGRSDCAVGQFTPADRGGKTGP